MQGSYQIFDASGQIMAERQLPLDREVCRNYRRDYFLAYRVYMPDQISPGSYRLELTLEDLKAPGRTLAVKAGTTGETWAIDHLPAARRVVFEDATACVLEVAQGRADAFIYDQLSIYKYAAQNPDTTRGLLEPFVQEAWAIGVARENGELLEKVNAFLRDFRQEKGLDALGERYLKEEKSALEAAGIPFILR